MGRVQPLSSYCKPSECHASGHEPPRALGIHGFGRNKKPTARPSDPSGYVNPTGFQPPQAQAQAAPARAATKVGGYRTGLEYYQYYMVLDSLRKYSIRSSTSDVPQKDIGNCAGLHVTFVYFPTDRQHENPVSGVLYTQGGHTQLLESSRSNNGRYLVLEEGC